MRGAMQAPDEGTVEFFVKLLSEEIGIKPEAAAQEYAAGLVEQGACMEDLEEVQKSLGSLPAIVPVV